jgi:undecaprenyl-diphosphatase
MDQSLFIYLNNYLNNLAVSIPALGMVAVIVATFEIALYPALLLWLWWRVTSNPDQRRRELLLAVVAGTLTLGINAMLNAAVPRARPFLTLPAHVLVARPADPSFPSDHTAITSAIALMPVAIGELTWGALALFGAVGIGMARVVVGVHYPSDILGAMVVGAAAAGIVLVAQRPRRPLLNFTLAVARKVRLA